MRQCCPAAVLPDTGSPQPHSSRGDVASERKVCRPATVAAQAVTCAWLLGQQSVVHQWGGPNVPANTSPFASGLSMHWLTQGLRE